MPNAPIVVTYGIQDHTYQKGYDSSSSSDYFWDDSGYSGPAEVHSKMSKEEQAPLLKGQVKRVRSPDSICSFTSIPENDFPDDQNFSQLVHSAELAIDYGVYPERIAQGSSGSYFVRECHAVCCFFLYLMHQIF